MAEQQKPLVIQSIEARQQISTTLPFGLYQDIKASGFHFNDLIILGFKSRTQLEELRAENEELRSDAIKAMEKIKALALRVNGINVDVMRLDKKNGM